MGKRKANNSNNQSASTTPQPQPPPSSAEEKEEHFVLPGDRIEVVSVHDSEHETIVLGTGLRQELKNGEEDEGTTVPHVYATLSGCLQYQCRTASSSGSSKKAAAAAAVVKKKHVYWIRSSNAARQLQLQDRVVGVVQERIGPDGAGGDYYRVHLGPHLSTGTSTAVLSNLSFEGATKRNKPALQTGQVLYARVAELPPDGCLEPVLSCVLGPHDSAAVKTKDWMTGEGVYGVLSGGTLLPPVSLGLARVLLSKEAGGLWDSVARHPLTSQFEVAIGSNGLVWLHAHPSPQAIIVLQNALLNSQLLTPEQRAGMVQQLVYTMKKQTQQQMDGGGGAVG